MTVVLKVTATPSTFPANTFGSAASAINGGVWRFTFTPTAASTTFTGGTFHAIYAQPHGGCWLNDASLELYTTPGDALCFSQPLTWSAGQTMTVTVTSRAGARQVVVSGATTGNGTFSFTQAGPYIDAATTFEVGQQGGGTFLLAGTIGSIDDTVPDDSWLPGLPTARHVRPVSIALALTALAAPLLPPSAPAAPPLSWAPTFPDRVPAAARARDSGAAAAPAATIQNATVPPLSWLPAFPDAVPRPRAPAVGCSVLPEAVIAAGVVPPLSWLPAFPDAPRRPQAMVFGGSVMPDAVLPNAAAPLLSWAPAFPDVVLRARAAAPASGHVAPVAALPNPTAPDISWVPAFPDAALRARRPHQESVFAPPFAGGQRLTVGTAAIRQNILSALAFTGNPLTTFGTDLTVTADATTDTLTAAAHGMVMCAGPFLLSASGTFPGNTDGVTPYYASVTGANTFKLALSATLAKAGTVVDITSNGTGTIKLLRTRDTSPLYSTFVAVFARGNQAASPNQATDSFGNTYTYMTGTPRAYDAFTASSASIAVKISGVGGPLHTWSASIGNVGGQEDEVVIGGLEIFHAPILKASSILERADGANAVNVSGTVQTTARALLVAVIFGNSNVNQDNTWTFLDGFTKVPKVCAEGDVNVSGYIQVEVAVRFVDIPGTYSYRAQGVNSSGGQMALLAFQSTQSDLSPLDWLTPTVPELPPRRRPFFVPGGESAPPLTALAVPPFGWSPAFPDRLTRPRAAVNGELSGPVSVSLPPFGWSPAFPDRLTRSAAASGDVVEPLVVLVPFDWYLVTIDRAARPRVVPSEVVAPLVSAAVRMDWTPAFPDRTTRATGTTVGDVAAPLVSAAIRMDWTPAFPDRLARTTAVAGEVVVVVVSTLPAVRADWTPAFPDRLDRPRVVPSEVVAPPVSVVVRADWAPTFPDRLARSRVAVSSVSAGPDVAIPNPAAPPLSWIPEFPDVTSRQRGVQIVGGPAMPDATLPNPAAPPLSWLPAFPDACALRPRAQPEAAVRVAFVPTPVVPGQRVVPLAGRGVAGVTRGIVTKVGGVIRTGGVRVALPSPTGEWNPQLNDNVVDFDRDAFTRFIDDKGYGVTWEKAVLCPNVPGTGLSPRDHAIGCPVCGGGGFVYVDAVPTKMLMQGVRFNQSFFAYGRWDMGNMLVTAEPELTIDYFDRLTLGNGVGRFTQRLVRQPGATADKLKYAPLCFHYVAWVDRSGALASFAPDVDFRTSADGSGIEWSSVQPDAGSFYTVSYDYRPRYVVLDLVHHHRDSTIEGQHYQFPVQAIAKLDYLIRNESADARQVVDQNPFK